MTQEQRAWWPLAWSKSADAASFKASLKRKTFCWLESQKYILSWRGILGIHFFIFVFYCLLVDAFSKGMLDEQTFSLVIICWLPGAFSSFAGGIWRTWLQKQLVPLAAVLMMSDLSWNFCRTGGNGQIWFLCSYGTICMLHTACLALKRADFVPALAIRANSSSESEKSAWQNFLELICGLACNQSQLRWSQTNSFILAIPPSFS